MLLKQLTCYSAGLEEPNAKRLPGGQREAGGEAGGEAAAEAGAQVDHTWRRVVSSSVSVATAPQRSVSHTDRNGRAPDATRALDSD